MEYWAARSWDVISCSSQLKAIRASLTAVANSKGQIMAELMKHPVLVFAISYLLLWGSSRIGVWIRRSRTIEGEEREDFNVIQAATLTLLGLIIGFSFSMAVNRYDLRVKCEADEANAIGTEYVRANLLPAADASQVRGLLREYLDLRIQFLATRDKDGLARINLSTGRLQDRLWSAVQGPALANPSPVTALAVSGMNDVLNTQGYTLAAWRNRIPVAAWGLLFAIALFCNALIGYGTRHGTAKAGFLTILPLVVSLSFFLIADIDSPRGGMIKVAAGNLTSLAESLR